MHPVLASTGFLVELARDKSPQERRRESASCKSSGYTVLRFPCSESALPSAKSWTITLSAAMSKMEALSWGKRKSFAPSSSRTSRQSRCHASFGIFHRKTPSASSSASSTKNCRLSAFCLLDEPRPRAVGSEALAALRP